MVRASKVTWKKNASFLVKLQAFCRSTSAKCVPRAGRTGTLFPDASCTKHTMQKMPRILLKSIVGAEDIASSHMTAPPTHAQINQWHYCTSDAVTAPPRVCLPEVPHLKRIQCSLWVKMDIKSRNHQKAQPLQHPHVANGYPLANNRECSSSVLGSYSTTSSATSSAPTSKGTC